METLNSTIASGGSLIAVTIIIVALLAVGFIVYRLIRRRNFASKRRNKQARLAVTDAISFGSKYKLVLLRRDDMEHLVLIGGATDLVVESNIRRNAAARPREQTAAAVVPLQAAKSQTSEEPVAAKTAETTEPTVAAAEQSPPSRLRPVANKSQAPKQRPQFVPRQEPAAPTPAETSQPAVAVATPSIRQAESHQEPAVTDSPAPKAEPLPPVSSPAAPAVVGGRVAAPLPKTASGNVEDTPAQEAPFREQAAAPVRVSDEESQSPETTTLSPRVGTDISADTAKTRHRSVSEDMDTLLNELSAKR